MDIRDKLDTVTKALLEGRRKGYSSKLKDLDVIVLCHTKEQANQFLMGITIDKISHVYDAKEPIMLDNAMLIELMDDAGIEISRLSRELSLANEKLESIEKILHPISGKGLSFHVPYTPSNTNGLKHLNF